jgi:ADP-ribosyl-[dinitrogen reductase] hydrolase
LPALPAAGDRQDRFRAALIGLAVGDALGFPLRGVPRTSLQRLPALAEDFSPRPRGRFQKGQFSDDTQLMLAAAESAVAERRIDGRAVAAHFAWLWREGVIVFPPRTLADALQRLADGVPWMSAGASLGVKEPSALSRALVAGLWSSSDRSRLSHDAGTLAIVTHKDPTCAAAAAAFASATALGLESPSAAPSAVCEAAASAARPHDPGLAEELRYLPRLLAWESPRALEQLRRIGVPPAQLRETEGIPSHVVPVLLIALYASMRVPHDFREAVALVLRAGGEADAAAALCGALMGAHLGTDAIPARLRRNVLYADHLQETADRLYAARYLPRPSPAVVAVRAGKAGG